MKDIVDVVKAIEVSTGNKASFDNKMGASLSMDMSVNFPMHFTYHNHERNIDFEFVFAPMRPLR